MCTYAAHAWPYFRASALSESSHLAFFKAKAICANSHFQGVKCFFRLFFPLFSGKGARVSAHKCPEFRFSTECLFSSGLNPRCCDTLKSYRDTKGGGEVPKWNRASIYFFGKLTVVYIYLFFPFIFSRFWKMTLLASGEQKQCARVEFLFSFFSFFSWGEERCVLFLRSMANSGAGVAGTILPHTLP